MFFIISCSNQEPFCRFVNKLKNHTHTYFQRIYSINTRSVYIVPQIQDMGIFRIHECLIKFIFL